MKIGIIGSRGIPNEYGGFEQFAEYLSVGLVKKGCEVWVYTSSSNSFNEKEYKGVKLIHCHDPEKFLGPFGQFVYDLNCIIDSRKRKFDIILQLGYTSSAIWNWLFNKKAILITNTDGLEWKRSKYHPLVQKFLKYSERLVVKKSDYLISDSKAMQAYTKKEYGRDSLFIPYGAHLFINPNNKVLNKYKLEPYRYNLVISRLQSDNNIEMIIQGHLKSEIRHPLLIIGNINNRFAKKLKNNYSSSLVRFAGGIYDQNLLNNLRFYSAAYFHGHSAGGTNPSLLEAMAAGAFICAHENRFNREVLGDEAYYFKNASDIAEFIHSVKDKNSRSEQLSRNRGIIETRYSIHKIINQYFEFFNQIKKK